VLLKRHYAHLTFENHLRGLVGQIDVQGKEKITGKRIRCTKKRKYPIENEAHARNALARVSRFGTPEEKKMVCEAEAKRYPMIHEKHCSMH
jgi:hypothetical protein